VTSELGVWTAEDCALILIDYQTEMVGSFARNKRRPGRAPFPAVGQDGQAFDVPIVLSTVGVGYGFNGPTIPSLLSELDGIKPIDRKHTDQVGVADAEKRAAAARGAH
jgi:hypothetical protein